MDTLDLLFCVPEEALEFKYTCLIFKLVPVVVFRHEGGILGLLKLHGFAYKFCDLHFAGFPDHGL